MARVMFVDDNVETLEMFKKCVELFGHQAVTARDPQEALHLAEEQDLDVVFVDLYLCESSGLEVVGALRCKVKTAHTPVYVLSAGSEYELGPKAKLVGANDFMQKPVRLQSLLQTISNAITVSGPALSLGGVQ
jgi:two-component system CheB/CheR fusion protein